MKNIRQANNDSNSPDISKIGIFDLLQISLLEMNGFILDRLQSPFLPLELDASDPLP